MDHDGVAVARYNQPWLHELSVCVDGNATALSRATGDVDASGAEDSEACAQGLFVDDRRILGVLSVQLGDRPTVAVASSSVGSCSEFLGSARHLGDSGPDPTIEVHRTRVLSHGGLREVVTITSRAAAEVRTDLVVTLGGDGATMASVKAGLANLALIPATVDGSRVRWHDAWHGVTTGFDPAPTTLEAGDAVKASKASFAVVVPPGGSVTVTVDVSVERLSRSNLDADPAADRVDWRSVSVTADDPRLEPAFRTGMTDLRHLLLTDPADPADFFAAAGTPWYLTLFGRDSLWCARMVLPFGTDLALGTLRTLARRQGTVVDLDRAESPGKIPHEVRRSAYGDPGSNLALPSDYYGTIDATPLWITLLHDAWRWGLGDPDVEALLPNLRAATRWLTDYAAPDDDGLLKYLDLTGRGLANQGWKDSGDSIRWRDGSVADAPIALVEAQGYAVEAARGAAALYEAFGVDGGADLRAWADDLVARLRSRFWVQGHDGPYLGIAVDGHGGTVDGVASNMGHLLGTGALDQDEVALVARTLTSPQMLGGYGIRTLSSDNGGFNPMGYHSGSVWTHDTAICAWGLAREGRRGDASQVARSLLASADAFDYRWPELYAGSGVADRPTPYPAACRPHGWSAASAAVLVSVALGFEPDAPNRTLTLRPASPAPFGAMTVRGLKFAGHEFGVTVAANGTAVLIGAPTDGTISVAPEPA